MRINSLFLVIAIGLLPACGPAVSPETINVKPEALPSPTESSTPSRQNTVILDNDSAPVTTPGGNATDSPLATPLADDQSSPIATPKLASIKTLAASPDAETVVAKAKEMLKQLPGLETKDDIALVNVEKRQWRDSSLGCPQEGKMYNQVITPGYLIVLQANGKQFEFHTNTTDTVVFCFIDGKDALNVLEN